MTRENPTAELDGAICVAYLSLRWSGMKTGKNLNIFIFHGTEG